MNAGKQNFLPKVNKKIKRKLDIASSTPLKSLYLGILADISQF